MNDLRAYEVSIQNINCIADNLGELGCIYEDMDLWGIYYATTASKAKHQFIKQYNGWDYRAHLEYTDPIKVRLLAKNVIQTSNNTDDGVSEDVDWCKADLTPRGQEIADGWEKAKAWLAAEEAGLVQA